MLQYFHFARLLGNNIIPYCYRVSKLGSISKVVSKVYREKIHDTSRNRLSQNNNRLHISYMIYIPISVSSLMPYAYHIDVHDCYYLKYHKGYYMYMYVFHVGYIYINMSKHII